jgi:hypothetical protein
MHGRVAAEMTVDIPEHAARKSVREGASLGDDGGNHR